MDYLPQLIRRVQKVMRNGWVKIQHTIHSMGGTQPARLELESGT